MKPAYRFEGQVQAVLVGRTAGSLETTRQESAVVTFEGFEGDCHSGMTRKADARVPHYKRGTLIRNERQVSLVSEEELAEVAAALGLPQVPPEWLGANLLLRGIPRLTKLPPGTRMTFSQGVVLRVEEENFPCTGPGKVIAAKHDDKSLTSRFVKAAFDRRGVVAVVEKPGVISAGDQVIVEVLPQAIYRPEKD